MVTIGIFLNPAATPACHLLCFLPVPSLAIASTTTLCLSLSSTIGMVLSAGSTCGSAETRSPEYTTFGPSALRVKDTLHKVHPSLLQLHSSGLSLIHISEPTRLRRISYA